MSQLDNRQTNQNQPVVINFFHQRQRQFTYFYSILTLITCLIFGTEAYFKGYTVDGIFNWILAFVLVVCILLLRITGKIRISVIPMLFATFALVIEQFVTGSVELTGMLWILPFPIGAFFMRGLRGGIMWTAILFVGLFLTTVLNEVGLVPIAYSSSQVREIFVALTFVSIMVFLYERTREQFEEHVLSSESRLQQSVQHLEVARRKEESILDNIGEGIVVTDEVGKIMYLNRACEDILSWKNEDMVGRNFIEQIPLYVEIDKPLVGDEHPLLVILKEAKELRGKFFIKTKNGAKIPIVITGTVISINNIVMGMVTIFRDIDREDK